MIDAATPKKASWFGKPKDGWGAFLQENGREVAECQGAGAVVAALLCYLDEVRQIQLMTSELDEIANRLCEIRSASYFFLTPVHRQAASALSSEDFSEAELRDYCNELNGSGDLGAGRTMLDALAFLREALGTLTDDSVVLLTIA